MYPGFSDYSAPSNKNTNSTYPSNQSGGSKIIGSTPTGSTGHLNYSTMNNDLNTILTLSEKKEIETPRELYVNIKMLDLIERIYTFERIQEHDYQEKTEGLLRRIEKITTILTQENPNFTIMSFVDKYGLKQCTWAISRLFSDPNKNKVDNSGLLIASVTTLLIRVGDTIAMSGEETTVGDMLTILENLKANLDKLKPIYHSTKNPFLLGDQYKPVIDKLSKMGINDKIPLKDLEEISKVNEYVRSKFQLSLGK